MENCISGKTAAHCSCTCTACDKRGNCCMCVAYHNERGEIPGCFFSADAERSYDRSLARLGKDRGIF